jgi:hypothetical protein
MTTRIPTVLRLYNDEGVELGKGANVDVGVLEIKLWRYWEDPANYVLDSVASELFWGPIRSGHRCSEFMLFRRSLFTCLAFVPWDHGPVILLRLCDVHIHVLCLAWSCRDVRKATMRANISIVL